MKNIKAVIFKLSQWLQPAIKIYYKNMKMNTAGSQEEMMLGRESGFGTNNWKYGSYDRNIVDF